jgi:hypothetical protein
VRSDDFSSILGLDMGIENTIGLHHDIGALLAKTMAAGKVNFSFRHALFDQLCLQGLIDSVTAT